eukprot:9409222-Lingulodinium_polyedra.AAC.1
MLTSLRHGCRLASLDVSTRSVFGKDASDATQPDAARGRRVLYHCARARRRAKNTGHFGAQYLDRTN